VWGVLACREDQLYCASYERCMAASAIYCDGEDDCGDGVDEPDNCSEPACSLSLSLDLLEPGDLILGQVVIESCSSRAWSEQWKW